MNKSGRKPKSQAQRRELRAAGITMLLLGVWFSTVYSQAQLELPDNPLRGRLLFEDKHCSQCHPIAGHRESLGPDLGTGRFAGSFFDLGAAMWNHVPGMSVGFDAAEIAWPQISDQEAIELTAFLYAIQYLGRPGDAAAGERLFRQKGCIACHAVDQEGGQVGPDLAELTWFASPLFVAQAIWNHGPAMLEAMQDMGVPQPRFEQGDLADLSAFIRVLSGTGPQKRMLLAPGNPNRGAERFDSKGCSKCHTVGARGGRGGPDLRRSDLHLSAEAIAGIMWNHATDMIAAMQERGVAWPTLTTKDLADLIAYLYFLPFPDPAGDPQVGQRVFAERTCTDCHVGGQNSSHPGPDLIRGTAAGSPEALVAAMWNHAPVMKEAILQEGRPWPELSGSELRDLFAYLCSTVDQD